MAQKSKKPAKAIAVKKKAAPSKATKPAVKVAKPAPQAKSAPKKSAVKAKSAPKKQHAPVVQKTAPTQKISKKSPATKTQAAAVKVPATKKDTKKASPIKKSTPVKTPTSLKKGPKLVTVVKVNPKKPVVVTGWLLKQRQRLLTLKDTLLDSMSGVGKDSLRSRAEGSEASAFGMHTADAGSDAYDRDFALSLLSQERDSLFEIDAALKKIEVGQYGVCEISGKPIPHARLEARPFARYTVECQAELEKTNRLTRVRQPVTSLFGLNEEEGSEGEEDETITESKE
jgi:RNA polymerase-binding transcription factor DksA